MYFDDLIKQVRVGVNLSPWPYEAKTIEGFPYELPLVVRSDGCIPAISSESRGALITYKGMERGGEKVYKLKGIDPNGKIPDELKKQMGKDKSKSINLTGFHLYAATPLRPTSDNYQPLQEDLPEEGPFVCGKYRQKPFGVIQKRKAENEALIEEMILDYLNTYNYLSPLKPVCVADFDKLLFNGEQTSCLVSEIPSIGSDLRVYEFNLLVNKSKSPADAVFETYKKLAEWIGFSIKMHQDLKLSPTDSSVGRDNYVLSKVSKKEIGVLKIDHTSTSIQSDIPHERIKQISRTSQCHVLHGRYKASKIEELERCFKKGQSQVPEPIPESEIMALFESS